MKRTNYEKNIEKNLRYILHRLIEAQDKRIQYLEDYKSRSRQTCGTVSKELVAMKPATKQDFSIWNMRGWIFTVKNSH